VIYLYLRAPQSKYWIFVHFVTLCLHKRYLNIYLTTDRLRDFFTEHSWGLFRNTMLLITGNLVTYVFFFFFLKVCPIYFLKQEKVPNDDLITEEV
jgi:hypothetical protein